MTKPILDQISENAMRYPDRLAFVTPVGQQVTYQKFHAAIVAFSSRLLDENVKPQQIVCVVVDNPVVSVSLWFALMRIGAIPCITRNVDNVFKSGVPVDAYIGLPDQNSVHAERITFAQDWFKTSGPADIEAEPAGMIFGSSGTTGLSKFMRIQPMVMEHRAAQLDRLNGACAGNCLIGVSVANAAAVRYIYRAIRSARGMLFVADNVADTLQLCATHNVGDLVAPPQYFHDLVCEIERNPSNAIAMERAEIGGGGASLQLFERGRAAFGCDIRFSYGSSELSTVAQGVPDISNDIEPGLVGPMQDWAEVRIVGGEGQDLTHGETGEILLRVPLEFRTNAYFGTDGPFDANGWFAPGDIGKLRADGQLVIEGRKSELINTGGNILLPEHVERVAHSFGEFRQIAAFAVPSAEGFDGIGLAIVADNVPDLLGLDQHLRDHFGASIVFRLVRLNELPQTPAGKLDRHGLRDLI